MHFSFLERLIWAVCLVLNFGLLLVLLVRGRWRQFPVLMLWMAVLIARTLILFFVYLHGSRHWYYLIYVGGSWVDFLLQLGLVLEIARIVLRPTGTWVQDARAYFVAAGVAGTVIAALLAWWISPPGTVRFVWQIRGNLFTSLVICELCTVVSMTANRLGLGWRSHVVAVAQGFTVWTSIMLLSTAFQSYLGAGNYRGYVGLDHVRELAYVAAISWMILQLWHQEPERQPISADLQEYILALHQRVEYDLRRLDARH